MKLAEIAYNKIETGISCTTIDGKKFVKFNDKDGIMKLLLGMIKSDNFHGARLGMKMCRRNGYDYPEFKAMEKSLGTSEKMDESAGELFEMHKFVQHDGICVWAADGKHVVKFSDKDAFLKLLLTQFKERGGDGGNTALHWIHVCRTKGYDYPEFKAIEKSMGTLDEGTKEDGVHVYDDPKDPYGHVVKFKDKEAFIKVCLHEMKTGSLSDVVHWILMAKECGYDYPEFKTILASIHADLKSRK